MNNFKLLTTEQIQKFYKETTDINQLMTLLLNQYKSDIQEIINELLKDGLTAWVSEFRAKKYSNFVKNVDSYIVDIWVFLITWKIFIFLLVLLV
ncbi:hypothetical protein ACXYFN_03150 [Mycoplasma sp. 48589B]